MIDQLTAALGKLEQDLSSSWQAGDQVLELLQKLQAVVEAQRFEFGQREQGLRTEIEALLIREGNAHTRANEAQAQSAELLAKVASLQEQLAEAKIAAPDTGSADEAIAKSEEAAAAAKAQFEAAIALKQAEIDKLGADLKAAVEQAAADRAAANDQVAAILARVQALAERNIAEQADVLAAAAPPVVAPMPVDSPASVEPPTDLEE